MLIYIIDIYILDINISTNQDSLNDDNSIYKSPNLSSHRRTPSDTQMG